VVVRDVEPEELPVDRLDLVRSVELLAARLTPPREIAS
jgi:hypothetical protein